jgi:pimeloyl-ACP methyl ester carboxylesterase
MSSFENTCRNYGTAFASIRSEMVLKSKKWKWGIAAGILVACVLLLNPFRHFLFSVRLASSLQALDAGATGKELAVRETKIRRRMGSRECEAILYRPAQSSAIGAIVVVPGISELGCYHPRLVALSRFLADRRLMVVTPDIPEFRNFEITAEPMDQILFWHGQVASLEGYTGTRGIGLAGISFSGTLALMAATRPEIRNDVGYVVAIGPYYNLIRCTGEWFKAEPRDSWNGYYPTKYYGRWIVMLSALDMIAENRDHCFLEDVLRASLLQQEVPPAAVDLTSEGLRWYRLATMPPDQSDPELAAKIEKYLISRIYPELDPDNFLQKVPCPVFLIHGAYDDLISPEESADLHRRLPQSYLLRSPFLTHTHPNKAAMTWKQKAAAAMETLIFCHRFAGILLRN